MKREDYVKLPFGTFELTTFEDRFALSISNNYSHSYSSLTVSKEKLEQIRDMINRFLGE